MESPERVMNAAERCRSIKSPQLYNICVAVWEKRRKDAKLVIEKIDHKLLRVLSLTSTQDIVIVVKF